MGATVLQESMGQVQEFRLYSMCARQSGAMKYQSDISWLVMEGKGLHLQVQMRVVLIFTCFLLSED